MPSIDKLALTCRFLYDERVLEQRKEIEKLQVKLFFKDYTEGNVERMIKRLNVNTECKCTACSVLGRISHGETEDASVVCTLGRWLDNVLHERGLVVLHLSADHDKCAEHDKCAGPYEEGVINHDQIQFTNADCHLVEHVDMSFLYRDEPVFRWRRFSIGKRLWNVESINNQDLKQFRSVFNISLVGFLRPMPPSSPKMAPLPPLPITITINQGLELQALKEQLAAQAAETQALKEQLEHVRDDTDNKRKRP